MKSLKKISLVYTLQVFAVILLFSFAGVSPVTETNTPLLNEKEKPINNSNNASKENRLPIENKYRQILFSPFILIGYCK